jgi:FkbM family methyltransferase
MFPEQLEIKNSNWLRNGSGLVGGTENLDAAPFNQLMNGFDHVTFERWEEPFSILKNQSPEFTKQFFDIGEAARPKLDDYLDELFRENQVRAVCQIGANDGIQNDPLRNYLSSPGAYRATLVEPIPYYAEKLRALYTGRPDIHIVQSAAGANEILQNFYFIPPSLAAEMNGDGPKNDWAHGQGSFYKESVVHWIKANGFRGPHYVSQIDNYINSIATIEIPTVKTEQVLPRDRVGLLLLIDVQGFEMEVLNGINWAHPPQWIVVEDDLGKTFELLKFFHEKNFRWVAGGHDKLFMMV